MNWHVASLPLLNLAVSLLANNPGYQTKTLDEVMEELLNAGYGVALWFAETSEPPSGESVH